MSAFWFVFETVFSCNITLAAMLHQNNETPLLLHTHGNMPSVVFTLSNISFVLTATTRTELGGRSSKSYMLRLLK